MNAQTTRQLYYRLADALDASRSIADIDIAYENGSLLFTSGVNLLSLHMHEHEAQRDQALVAEIEALLIDILDFLSKTCERDLSRNTHAPGPDAANITRH